MHGYGTAFERLRDVTRAAHRSIETAPPLARLLAPDLLLAEYIVALQVMQAFHTAVSLRIGPGFRRLQAANGAEWGADTLRLLRDDLDWFAAPAIAPIHIMSPDDLPASLGMLYVAEGSALGARVIARQVGDRLGVSPGRGGSFYDPEGRGRCPRSWERFRALLAKEVQRFSGDDEAAMQRAALASFAALEAALRAQGSP